jgi:hypothetical protein
MTLRNGIAMKKTATALGIGLLLTVIAGACAEARPIDTAARGPLTSRAAGYELEVLVDGVPAPTFLAGGFQGGGSYVLGQLGARYTLRITNHTGRRIEAVASVDGRDVVDGRAADFRGKRGYLVPAYGQVDIDGWRLNRAEVAAFRFSSVAASYAARTGSAREVGVIGAAIFPERFAPRPRPLELPYTDPRASAPRASEDGRHGSDAAPFDEGGARDKASMGASGAAAPAAPSRGRAEADVERRPGLGTEFGEEVSSSVREVDFVRANASVPAVVLGAHYDDRDGLVALGIDVEPDTCGGWSCDRDLRETARPFPVSERRYAAPPPCWSGRVCRQ